MTIAYVLDEVFAGHVPPSYHPERPERVGAVVSALKELGLDTRGLQLPTREATDVELGLVHEAGYIEALGKKVPGNTGWLDPDTYFSPGTWDSALAAAAAGVDLAAAVMDGRARRGLAVVRPPGHHAEADQAMGFCLFNNVAIAARSAREAGASRVAIVDWDVHHGNGTQQAFYDDPSVLFVSVHQYPFFPGTGRREETGSGDAAGTTINVPLPAGSGDDEYAAVFDDVFCPALREFRPDIVFVSAGFDAHQSDPLAGMRVSTAEYRRMAEKVCAIADELAGGRVVAMLEGGYDLEGLGDGFAAMVGAMEAT